jgi:hypothetical protein
MYKSATGLLCAFIAGSAMIGATAAANADYRHGGCCGPIPPSYSYGTVERVSHRTNYHDVWHKTVVNREKLYVHVERVQPVVYVNNVTRIHDQLVEKVHPVHVSRVEYLPTETVVTASVVHINEGCVCDYCK